MGRNALLWKSKAHLLVCEGHAQQTPSVHAHTFVNGFRGKSWKQGLFPWIFFVFKTLQRMRHVWMPWETGQSVPRRQGESRQRARLAREGVSHLADPGTVLSWVGRNEAFEREVLEYILYILSEGGIHLAQRTRGFPSCGWASLFWCDPSSQRHPFSALQADVPGSTSALLAKPQGTVLLEELQEDSVGWWQDRLENKLLPGTRRQALFFLSRVAIQKSRRLEACMEKNQQFWRSRNYL